MTPNNNLNVLAFYPTIQDQNHRKSYSYGDIFPLISPSRIILPFQLVRNHLEASPITVFKLINYKTGVEYDILTDMYSDNLYIREYEGVDIILNYGRFLLDVAFNFSGLFYLYLTDGTNEWYSDIFNFVQDVSNYLKLVYYNRNEFFEYTGGAIDYNDGYQNFCYLNTEIGKPRYPFEEDIQERDGYTFVEKQISEKIYVFEFETPEYLMDALRIVRMHDYIYVESLGKQYDVEQFLIDVEWKEQGNLGTAEVEFQCDTIMKRIGKGFINLVQGDYNEDFNNDFFGGGGGSTPTPYLQTFEVWTGSAVPDTGDVVYGSNVKINIKGETGFIYDQTLTNDYKTLPITLTTGITYEITVSREGYNDQTIELLNGVAGGTTAIVLIEDPLTINLDVNLSGYDGGIIPNVDVVIYKAFHSNTWLESDTGASGVLPITFKKGIEYNITLSKVGYVDSDYILLDYEYSTLLINMIPS